MAAHVANKKAQLEVNMLLCDPQVCHLHHSEVLVEEALWIEVGGTQLLIAKSEDYEVRFKVKNLKPNM